jgi:hypothetical protein
MLKNTKRRQTRREANNPQDNRIRANIASHSIGVAFLFHYGDRNDQKPLSMVLREDSTISVKKPRQPYNWVEKSCYFTVLRVFWVGMPCAQEMSVN